MEIGKNKKDIFSVTIPTGIILAIIIYFLMSFIIKTYGLNSDTTTTIFGLLTAAALFIQLIGSKIIDIYYYTNTKKFEEQIEKLKADLDKDINAMIIKECSRN